MCLKTVPVHAYTLNIWRKMTNINTLRYEPALSGERSLRRINPQRASASTTTSTAKSTQWTQGRSLAYRNLKG